VAAVCQDFTRYPISLRENVALRALEGTIDANALQHAAEKAGARRGQAASRHNVQDGMAGRPRASQCHAFLLRSAPRFSGSLPARDPSGRKWGDRPRPSDGDRRRGGGSGGFIRAGVVGAPDHQGIAQFTPNRPGQPRSFFSGWASSPQPLHITWALARGLVRESPPGRRARPLVLCKLASLTKRSSPRRDTPALEVLGI
jgi:hypothetical protein